LPHSFLKETYKLIREGGGVCIADEVQTGLGRVGEKYWAFELAGVIPDIVTIGKPLGNGHPVAAVVTTEAIAEAFDNGMEYFNTFGGNPVSSAIGLEVLRTVEEENLQDHALQMGNLLRSGLLDLKTDFPIIADVRGHGLFQGIELLDDMESMEPAGDKAAYLANRMKVMGVLMSTDGPDHNVMKIKPPLCINSNDIDYLLDHLNLVFQENYMQI